MTGPQASSVGASATERCNMICRNCGLDKPPTEFYDGKYRCKPCLAVYFKQYERKRVRMPRGRHERSAEVTNVSGDTPRPASVYLKPEAIYHARCEQPLTLTGYFLAVGGFPDDLEALALQETFQPLAEDQVIVG